MQIKQLELKAIDIRMRALRMIYESRPDTWAGACPWWISWSPSTITR